mmetsp:Transcript_23793/g.56569  ORF Transcript_23793/g.56569 Transcript_23793/m.56569 type:complete len:301 (-) Transcript_23793:766-1668(-)|eukprot:CAMPEP_0175963090 /NCGR_PEP_ID=MMETSP0108-20121206/36830_1 /TAXON_ID=195067 ORGANISM="Goniomonas pacifica, Strain CCMP1869" /NCGR_SAMPLE_ID=MMETSP0108 /ASSEMBLY_ACC=CAM_ASM_000204 /LENGTH=300 /DNA_ID=CAMNT_0017290957 /DNA_START=11 /DNA_END=913 /DNA_ORIENTATION=-
MAEEGELWKEVFLCGTEWHTFKDVHAISWDFSHLEEELTEGKFAKLGEKDLLYLFGGTEPQMVDVNGESRVVPIPWVVVVETQFPAPELLGLNSVQTEKECIEPMSKFKMGWHPLPIETPTEASAGRKRRKPESKPKVFCLKCVQRNASLGRLTEERLHRFDYCMPYIMFPHHGPGKVDTAVEIIVEVPGRTAPVVFEFDWSMDDVDDMVEEQMEEQSLPADFKATLDKTIRDTVNKTKAERRAARDEKQKQLDAIPEEEKEALKNLKTTKFYPCNKDPDVSSFRSKFINRYYGQANNLA